MDMDWAHIFKGKVVLVGVGHLLKGDDALGPALMARLEGKVKAVCLDAGTSPENYLGKIIREAPQTIIFVDAVHLGQPPGSYALLEKNEIIQSGLTTHDFSPRMLLEHLSRETRAEIYLLAVQPKQLHLGEPLSPEVEAALEGLEKIFEALPDA